MRDFRKYGKPPFSVILLHGGPGAVGDLAAVADIVSSKTGVIEALQTRYSIEELIEESCKLITEHARIPVTLAGHSWGAWLGILIAERYPDLVRKLILVSSGPFEQCYARNIMQTRMERLSPGDNNNLQDLISLLNQDQAEKNSIFKKIGQILNKADILQLAADITSNTKYNYAIYEAIWPSAAKLRDSGELMSAASHITCPVVALHGDYDPHPSTGVFKPLSENLRDFKFILLKNCGHYPWMEKNASKKFYKSFMKEIMH